MNVAWFSIARADSTLSLGSERSDRSIEQRKGVRSIFGSSTLTRNVEDRSISGIWGAEEDGIRADADVGRRRRQAWYTAGDLDPRPRLPLVRSLVDMCRSSSPSIHTPANPTLPCPTSPAYPSLDATRRRFSDQPELSPLPPTFLASKVNTLPFRFFFLIYSLSLICNRYTPDKFSPCPLSVCPFSEIGENSAKRGRREWTRLSTAWTQQHRLVSKLVVDVHVHDDDAVPTFNAFGARVVSISPKPPQATATFRHQLRKKMVVYISTMNSNPSKYLFRSMSRHVSTRRTNLSYRRGNKKKSYRRYFVDKTKVVAKLFSSPLPSFCIKRYVREANGMYVLENSKKKKRIALFQIRIHIRAL